jgi:hypothetical protein
LKPSLKLLKAICPFGLGNAPANALWLIWIAEILGSSSSMIAEIAKRKANLVETGESIIPLILLLPIFVAPILHQKRFIYCGYFFSFQINVPNSYY